MPHEKPEDSNLPEKIRTTSEMMDVLGREINDIKAGTIEEARARLVWTGRKLQLLTAQIQLQYARLVKGRRPEPFMPLLSPPEEPKE